VTVGIFALLVSVAFLLLLSLKLLAVLNAVRWLTSTNAELHHNTLKKLHSQRLLPSRILVRSFRTNRGTFLPYGAMDFRLTRREEFYHARLRHCWRRMCGTALHTRIVALPNLIRLLMTRAATRFFRLVLFRVTRLSLISAVYIVVLSFLGINRIPGGAAHIWLLLLMATAILVAWGLECAVGYASFGDYLAVFRNEIPLRVSPAKRTLVGLHHLIRLAATNVTLGALSVMAIDQAYGLKLPFTNLLPPVPDTPVSLTALIEQFVNCTYFCLTTFTTLGYGDIHPAGLEGRMVSMMIQLQAITLIVLVFSISINNMARRDSGGEGR
jgi:hypothetical protein